MKSKILIVDLDRQKSKIEQIDVLEHYLGGSGLAACLFEKYGLIDEPASHPRQPVIWAIGPLSAMFPMMSKVVMAFKSPYNEQYTESHAGGRLAMAMRFSGYQAIVLIGKCARLSVLEISDHSINFFPVPFLEKADVFSIGKILRRITKLPSGQRSILRIGPAGENKSPIACVNVDTYRHFGRLGGGAALGYKNIKALVIGGRANTSLQEIDLKAYQKRYQELYQLITTSGVVKKYHDLGTAQNLIPLNELKCLPWNNLQKTSDPGIEGISGEAFAQKLLLRKTACAGCPVGCIHIALLREQFGQEHEFLFRQVAYDYELIFALGSMLGLKDAEDVLRLIEQVEREGLDAISAGVLLAYVTEGLEKGLFSIEQTLVDLAFEKAREYVQAIHFIANPPNEFWQIMAQGLAQAVQKLGGEDFACVLGQEMAGYATGENYFVSQALGFRHSHLDLGAYSLDQSSKEKDVHQALEFFQKEEKYRVMLTSCVGCLFARKAYSWEQMASALSCVGLNLGPEELQKIAQEIAVRRWRLKIKTGFDPETVKIPKRYLEVETFKGKIDTNYLEMLRQTYARYIKELVK
ncbi:MAG: aldehyde ferredoxin oxidoreductase C-terminal domain-containing protein [Desulfonauticus sp.]|nr:aldehyde ferredoxin oxidoreductase C-terminal domain-containing protein [Desulfonauticus sp.]